MTDDTAQTLLDNWNDLHGRLEHAADLLIKLADDATDSDEERRLDGKAQGVILALSYMRDYIVSAPTESVPALPLEWGERAVRFIDLLLTTPGLSLLDNERAGLDQLVTELNEARNA